MSHGGLGQTPDTDFESPHRPLHHGLPTVPQADAPDQLQPGFTPVDVHFITGHDLPNQFPAPVISHLLSEARCASEQV